MAIILCAGIFSPHGLAHLQSESVQRAKLRWQTSQIPLVLEHVSTDLTAAQSQSIIGESINAWNAVSPVRLQPAAQAVNKVSYSSDPRFFGPGVVAVTSLGFSAGNGVVSSGEILINQTNSRGFCLGVSKTSSPCIYLGDVMTHELGHFFGLSHSEVKHSSMLYVAQKSQFSPHADDAAGVRSIYAASTYGSLSGEVLGGNSVPVFGAHVQAISLRTGGVAAASVSDENGYFKIGGLPVDDTYVLYVEPLAHLEALPDPYRSVKNDFCPGTWVGSFFEGCGTQTRGHPQPLRLTSLARNLSVGAVTIRCQLRLDPEYLLGKSQQFGGVHDFVSTPNQPVQSFVGSYPADIILPTDFASSVGLDDQIEIDLSGLAVPAQNAKLELRVMTVPLGASLDFAIGIEGPAGVTQDSDRVLSGGYGIPALETGSLRPIFERRLTYLLSPTAALNRFTITLKPRALRWDEQGQIFPSSGQFMASHRPWLAWVSVINDSGVVHELQTSTLSDNRSCLDAPYTRSLKPNPVSGSALAGNGIDDTTVAATAPAACGTIDPPDRGSGPGSSGFLLTLVAGFLLASLRRFRST
jgi:hypothetical protein